MWLNLRGYFRPGFKKNAQNQFNITGKVDGQQFGTFFEDGIKISCLLRFNHLYIKFVFSKKATKIEKIFTVFLTVCTCSKCQIDGEDFVIFFGLLRKYKL